MKMGTSRVWLSHGQESKITILPSLKVCFFQKPAQRCDTCPPTSGKLDKTEPRMGCSFLFSIYQPVFLGGLHSYLNSLWKLTFHKVQRLVLFHSNRLDVPQNRSPRSETGKQPVCHQPIFHDVVLPALEIILYCNSKIARLGKRGGGPGIIALDGNIP